MQFLNLPGLIVYLEVVWMPLLGQLTVCLGHILLFAVALESQDFVVIPLGGLLLPFLSSLKAIFGTLEILVQV